MVTSRTLAPDTSKLVTIIGSGFAGSAFASVSGDGVTAGKVTVVSPTKLTVKLTARPTASFGARDILISFVGSPVTVDSCSGCLTVTEPPILTSLDPNHLPTSPALQSLMATGSRFKSGLKMFSQHRITISAAFVSSTQLNLSVKVPGNVAAGSYNVIVQNPAGGNVTCSGCLTVTSSS